MTLRSLSLRVSSALADPLTDALVDAGALSVSVEDAQAGTDQERPHFGEPGSSPAAWDDNLIRALLPEELDPAHALRAALDACGELSIPPFAVDDVPADDWVRRTQSQFDPVRITGGLWVVPSWHQVRDPDAINIRLDPGLAFGTGTHPTTQLCMRWLCKQPLKGRSVLDYGCGSGILGLTAARLAAGEVWGVDIDDAALTATHANAEANGVSMRVQHVSIALDATFDFVVANILANPLRLLAPALAARVRPGGKLALSGLLSDQGDDIAACYSSEFAMRTAGEQEGWLCLEGTRR